MPLSIEIYVICNSLAMCMDITETYDDMISDHTFTTAFVNEKTHLGVRV